jgi:glucosylceramidase
MNNRYLITRKLRTAAAALLLADAMQGCHGGDIVYGNRDGSLAAGQTGQLAGGGVGSQGGTRLGGTAGGAGPNESNGGAGRSTTQATSSIARGGVAATGTTDTGSGASTATGGSPSSGGTGNGNKGGATGIGGTSSAKGGNSATGGSGNKGGTTGIGGESTNPQGGNTSVAGAAPKGGSGGAATGGSGATPGTTTVFTSDGKADASNGKSAPVTEVTTATADVTVNDASALQTWEGFGGCFNEMGWDQISSSTSLQTEAINLLFGSDGANFAMGRIPIGASDYATSRYTLDDTGTDVTPDSSESNRPAADTALTKFSITRDQSKLLPYVKAAQTLKPSIRFWASPWTPPVWMKTGYAKGDGSGGTVKRPSYYDGGTMRTDDATLKAHAQYLVKFVQEYAKQNITIETIAPQNEPNFEQNYPSCLWSSANFTSFVGKHLGPAIKDAGLGTKIMLGAMSNGDAADKDQAIVSAVMADSTAKSFISVVGVQWSMMEKLSSYKSTLGNLPVWVSEHKCGNYPWNPPNYPPYISAKAPNDIPYAVESWGYIRDAIKAGVTAYNAWNMILDPVGKGIDTSRDWAQNSLLTVSGGKITKTPTYWVFRHVSQFAAPGGKVVATTGSSVDSIGFKNPDGSLVAVIYNSGAAKSTFTVSIGGKKLQFAMPAAAWATVYLPKT